MHQSLNAVVKPLKTTVEQEFILHFLGFFYPFTTFHCILDIWCIFGLLETAVLKLQY